MAADPPASRSDTRSPDDSAIAGSIMSRPRWRAAVTLGGMGDSILALLPLFVIGALKQPVEVAAGAAAAYTFGAMLGHVFLWGRLADRTAHPRAQVILGTAVQGSLLVGLGVFPTLAGIVAISAVLGLFAVSMDSALMRLVTADLAPKPRTVAVLRFARLVERGVLLGLLVTAVALPLLRLGVDDAIALRAVVVALGAIILAESLIVATATGPLPSAPTVVSVAANLAADGLLVLWSGASGPVQQLIRVTVGSREPSDTWFPDTLRLLLINLVVLHLGFALHSGIFAVYLHKEGGLASGAVAAILLGGSVMTNLTIPRVSEWLQTIPAVQVQAGAAGARAVLFGGYAALALAADAPWSLAGVALLYLLGQMCWGAVLPANTVRVSTLAPPGRQARAMSLFSGATGSGTVIGTTLAGTLAASVGFPVTFAAAAGVTLVAVALLLRW